MKKKDLSCPDCKDGQLVLIQDPNNGNYYACNSCSYTIHNIIAVETNTRCPQCNDFLIITKGKEGKTSYFLKCHRLSCGYRSGNPHIKKIKNKK